MVLPVLYFTQNTTHCVASAGFPVLLGISPVFSHFTIFRIRNDAYDCVVFFVVEKIKRKAM